MSTHRSNQPVYTPAHPSIPGGPGPFESNSLPPSVRPTAPAKPKGK